MPGPLAWVRSRVQGRDPAVFGEGATFGANEPGETAKWAVWGVQQWAGGDALAGRRRRRRVSEKYNIIGKLAKFDGIRIAVFRITY